MCPVLLGYANFGNLVPMRCRRAKRSGGEIKVRLYLLHLPFFAAISYHRWSKDAFTQGAYSEPVVGTTSQDLKNIGERLGRLYFAGEATSEEWIGYMQGAYLSGKENGQMIADDLMSMSAVKYKTGYRFGETDIHEEL